MRLLLSNDDGYHAEGLTALRTRLADSWDDIITVAPDRNRSGASNSLTIERPIRVRAVDTNLFAVDGTPTDCVHLATSGFLDRAADIVVSGINAGSNMGDDVLYSGTIAAATEGRSLGLPAIAVSLAGAELKHYDTAARVIVDLLNRLIKQPLNTDTVLNVNVPDIAYTDVQGWTITRLGDRHIGDRLVTDTDPRGRTIYWIGEAGQQADAGPGTDFHAVDNNQVSITPLQVDRTRHRELDNLRDWLAD